MKIVCGTDFSEQAFRATEVAARLARRLGDTLVVAHVIQSPVYVPHATALDVANLRDALRGAAEPSLRDIATLLRRRKVDVEERLLEGSPGLALLELARQEGARLICVGTHGRRAPARWFVGSVAEAVVTRSDRPVLVVRDGAPILDSDDAAAPLRALAAIDSTPASDSALRALGELRRFMPCDVTLLHAYWAPEEYERLGLQGPRDLTKPDPDVVAVLERELRPKVALIGGLGAVRLHIEPSVGALPEVLANAAEEGRYDILVIGTHQWRGTNRLRHGSVSSGVIHAARVPVLVVPQEPQPGHVGLPPLRHVLVATDLSEVGNNAVRYAYALIEGRGGEVDICFVHSREGADPIYAYEPPGAPLSAERRAGLERDLMALVPEGAAAQGIITRANVVEATRPAEGIVQAAERLGADAVCVGSHGRGGLASALGSVAAAVLRRSTKPVLVVRPAQR
jgi:nucleotide-binding universal stress UspA family protein